MDDDFAIVDPEAVETERFPESDILHKQLTERLGCTDLRVNEVTLEPGQATTPHTHERQEEVYLSLTGGTLRIGETDHEVPPGGLVRIGPDPVRSVRNDIGEGSDTWLMFGAPPRGSVDDFGEYRLPED